VVGSVEKGLAKAGRKRSDFTITAPVMAVMGSNEQEIDVWPQFAFFIVTDLSRPVVT
jgi:hypothetical protein